LLICCHGGYPGRGIRTEGAGAVVPLAEAGLIEYRTVRLLMGEGASRHPSSTSLPENLRCGFRIPGEIVLVRQPSPSRWAPGALGDRGTLRRVASAGVQAVEMQQISGRGDRHADPLSRGAECVVWSALGIGKGTT
jgi:hypothetical protein